MAVRLKDARIIVKLDTSQAERKAEGARRDRTKKDEREDARGKKDRQDRNKTEARKRKEGRLAIIPGVGKEVQRLWRVMRGLVAIRVFEETTGQLGGFIEQAGKGKFVEEATDLIGDLLTKAASAITHLRTSLAAYLTLTGQVTDMARAQKIIEGEVDFPALYSFAERAHRATQFQAEAEARKSLVGRHAMGGVLAEFAEELKQKIYDHFKEGSQN